MSSPAAPMTSDRPETRVSNAARRRQTKDRWWSVLPNWKFQPFPRDTKTIITSVFLGLITVVVLQIAERIDLAITGGTVAIVSAVVSALIWISAASFYGFTGALITAWINPIISNLTASSPMAPFFFLTNGSHGLSMALLVWLMKPKHRGLKLWEVLVIGQVGGLADAVVFGLGNRLILHMPWDFIGFQILIIQPAYFLGSLITYGVMRRVIKTGLIPRPRARVTEDTVL